MLDPTSPIFSTPLSVTTSYAAAMSSASPLYVTASDFPSDSPEQEKSKRSASMPRADISLPSMMNFSLSLLEPMPWQRIAPAFGGASGRCTMPQSRCPRRLKNVTRSSEGILIS